jgi:hypothetical protein
MGGKILLPRQAVHRKVGYVASLAYRGSVLIAHVHGSVVSVRDGPERVFAEV